MKRRKFIQKSAFLGILAGFSIENFAKKNNIHLAYSAITWGGKDALAIREISELGFKGIQLRANAVPVYKDKIQNLQALLKHHNLTLAMFSSGNVEIDPAKETSTIAAHMVNANFVKSLGGKAMQLTNNVRPKDRKPTNEELIRLATVMNEIGKQTLAVGVQATYHNHMGQLGETPEEVDTIVQHLDTKYVKLLLDIAHYHQGGGDPAQAVLKYKDIIHAVHLKDVQCPKVETPTDAKSYRFVELGQGKVNIKGVLENLAKIKFDGWAVVELDGVPDASKTPFSSGEISKKFLQEQGFKFS